MASPMVPSPAPLPSTADYDQIDHLDAEVRRIFNTYDAKVIREGYGQLPAWFCRLPGQPPQPQRP